MANAMTLFKHGNGSCTPRRRQEVFEPLHQISSKALVLRRPLLKGTSLRPKHKLPACIGFFVEPACILVQAADERATRDNNSLVERNQRMMRELQEQMATNARLAEVNKVKAAELKQMQEAVRSLQSETAKVVKVKEAALTRIKAIEKQKGEIEKVNEQLR